MNTQSKHTCAKREDVQGYHDWRGDWNRRKTETSPRVEPTRLGLQDLKAAAWLQQLRQWEAVEGAQRPLWARF